MSLSVNEHLCKDRKSGIWHTHLPEWMTHGFEEMLSKKNAVDGSQVARNIHSLAVPGIVY